MSCKALVTLALVAATLSLSGCAEMQIREKIVSRSQQLYKGVCPCPYSVDRAGRSCGERSAYSRLGPTKALCYSWDVPAEVVEDYKRMAAKEAAK